MRKPYIHREAHTDTQTHTHTGEHTIWESSSLSVESNLRLILFGSSANYCPAYIMTAQSRSSTFTVHSADMDATGRLAIIMTLGRG